MVNQSISNKILDWYDNNKRDLPWRKPRSKIQSQYFTLVSEVMLQQTQVNTVIPYFDRFIRKIPDIQSLSKVNDNKLFKLWEGLGYYSRAKNLKKAAKLIVKNKNCELPSSIEELKKLPGIGDYTSRAILALEFNKKVIPLDGNIERLLKRVLFLRKKDEISKQNLKIKTYYFGNSIRQRDYVQALMEIGSLVCKPMNPICDYCPIKKNCISFKKKDFIIIKKSKVNKIKYFKVNIYHDKRKILLIQNQKFNFLKNLLIFPMTEINSREYKISNKRKIQIKMSNMDMKITININNKMPLCKGKIVEYEKFSSAIIPSFTKKIFKVALS